MASPICTAAVGAIWEVATKGMIRRDMGGREEKGYEEWRRGKVLREGRGMLALTDGEKVAVLEGEGNVLDILWLKLAMLVIDTDLPAVLLRWPTCLL